MAAKHLLNSLQISPYRLKRSKHSIVAYAFRHFYRHVNPPRLAAVGHCHLFDRYERGELRHQPVFQAELSDRFAHIQLRIVILYSGVILAHQIIDSRARPECRQRVMFGLRFW